MNFLTAIIDGLVRFVQRNPLTTLVILILAVGAPALLIPFYRREMRKGKNIAA